MCAYSVKKKFVKISNALKDPEPQKNHVDDSDAKHEIKRTTACRVPGASRQVFEYAQRMQSSDPYEGIPRNELKLSRAPSVPVFKRGNGPRGTGARLFGHLNLNAEYLRENARPFTLTKYSCQLGKKEEEVKGNTTRAPRQHNLGLITT